MQQQPEIAGDAVRRVGVVADPGLPSRVAAAVVDRGLADLLSRRVSCDVRWEVELVGETLPLNEQRRVPLLESAARRKPERGWDVLVYVTDLPRCLDTQPVVADLSTSHGAVLISLPALGPFRPRRHVTDTLVHLLRQIYQAHTEAPPGTGAKFRSRPGRLLRCPSQWAGPVREITAGEDGIDASLALIDLRGRLRLLLGMVRANRPWRLVPHMASATAAAAATAAFGLFYSSIWNMADALSPVRFVLIMFLSIGVMVAWLLLYNHLWDTGRGQASRRQVVLYNAATLTTVFLGVLCMYVLLVRTGAGVGIHRDRLGISRLAARALDRRRGLRHAGLAVVLDGDCGRCSRLQPGHRGSRAPGHLQPPRTRTTGPQPSHDRCPV
ncbi:hypothetical protein ABT269_35495 [Streptomyces viridosporus]|uniref:hypothetical protein n=1 Tax=Streptomyces viridosporus TaxID=67581 RepID=UPI00331F72C8